MKNRSDEENTEQEDTIGFNLSSLRDRKPNLDGLTTILFVIAISLMAALIGTMPSPKDCGEGYEMIYDKCIDTSMLEDSVKEAIGDNKLMQLDRIEARTRYESYHIRVHARDSPVYGCWYKEEGFLAGNYVCELYNTQSTGGDEQR